jgi:hypothetical protein
VPLNDGSKVRLLFKLVISGGAVILNVVGRGKVKERFSISEMPFKSAKPVFFTTTV